MSRYSRRINSEIKERENSFRELFSENNFQKKKKKSESTIRIGDSITRFCEFLNYISNPNSNYFSDNKVTDYLLGRGMPHRIRNAINFINFAIKNKSTEHNLPWKVRFKSLDSNIVDCVNYYIGSYKYPGFFKYLIFDSDVNDRYNKYTGILCKMMICISSGKSLYREIFRYYGLTKRESHIFTSCTPNEVKTPDEAILYAIVRVACEDNNKEDETFKFFSLFKNIIQDSRISRRGSPFWDNFQYYDLIKFLIKYNYGEVKDGYPEYFDCLNTKMFERVDGKFIWSFKNRTLSSIKRISNDWHLEQSKLRYDAPDSKWSLLFDKKVWDSQIEDISFFKKHDVKIVELNTAKELCFEGNRMHHCVASYVDTCLSGKVHIFSASIDGMRTTIEVRKNGNCGKPYVNQISRAWNKSPNISEFKIIRKWCNENNISCSNRFADREF